MTDEEARQVHTALRARIGDGPVCIVSAGGWCWAFGADATAVAEIIGQPVAEGSDAIRWRDTSEVRSRLNRSLPMIAYASEFRPAERIFAS